MLKATIEINVEGAAFYSDDEGHAPHYEVSRILRILAATVEEDRTNDRMLYDINGNQVGTFHVDVLLDAVDEDDE